MIFVIRKEKTGKRKEEREEKILLTYYLLPITSLPQCLREPQAPAGMVIFIIFFTFFLFSFPVFSFLSSN
jgi:hypothetical protein